MALKIRLMSEIIPDTGNSLYVYWWMDRVKLINQEHQQDSLWYVESQPLICYPVLAQNTYLIMILGISMNPHFMLLLKILLMSRIPETIRIYSELHSQYCSLRSCWVKCSEICEYLPHNDLVYQYGPWNSAVSPEAVQIIVITMISIRNIKK